MNYNGCGRNVVEKNHQNLHSSRAYLHNRSASEMFLGAFLCTISKVLKMAEIANFLSRQKKRIIAASSEPVSTQFLQPITTRIGDCSSCTFSMVYLLHWTILYRSFGFTFSFDPHPHWARRGVQTLLNKKVPKDSDMSKKMRIFATNIRQPIYAKH